MKRREIFRFKEDGTTPLKLEALPLGFIKDEAYFVSSS